MTGFRVEEVAFDADFVTYWAQGDPRFRNWPVVYTLQNPSKVYVGESLNAAKRLREHLESPEKVGLTKAKVILADTFNKSACLDLESYLIRLFAGDGEFEVLNRNAGVIDAEYFDRSMYQAMFDDIFDDLQRRGLFKRSVREIENGDLFKLSPFKALTQDQAVAIDDILHGLFDDIAYRRRTGMLVQGDPGTGKTVIAIYLIKLLMDIKVCDVTDPVDEDTLFAEFFVPSCKELLTDFRVGLVIPQQSLRTSVKAVFKKTPGLDPAMVLSPFDVGLADEPFDLLVVDETHRLNHRANQSSGTKNQQFAQINERLFGEDGNFFTQLDWVRKQSRYQVFLLDSGQSVRPADLPEKALQALRAKAERRQRSYRLTSQLRVAGGEDYIAYVRAMLSDAPPKPALFPDYDFRLFDDFAAMVRAIKQRDRDHGLARLVAGYAWPWRSRKDKSLFDIEVGGVRLRWNSTDVDWVNKVKEIDEVGSIHTIQGYDLNYAGVIIGRDLVWDRAQSRLRFDRSQYFDAKGKENNKRLGISYSDDDLLRFVANIYAVLLTRGIRGTYVYVCDPALREQLRGLIPSG